MCILVSACACMGHGRRARGSDVAPGPTPAAVGVSDLLAAASSTRTDYLDTVQPPIALDF